jgi:hypothetical protein
VKKLTTKWKLFLIANYFLLILNGILILTFFIRLLFPNNTSFEMSGEAFLFILFVLIICLIYFLNIFIVHRYFPDTPLGIKHKKLFIASRGIFLLLVVLLLFFAYGVILAISDEDRKASMIDYYTTGYVILLFALSLFILILQFQIPNYLNKKNSGKINTLIESIGQ